MDELTQPQTKYRNKSQLVLAKNALILSPICGVHTKEAKNVKTIINNTSEKLELM